MVIEIPDDIPDEMNLGDITKLPREEEIMIPEPLPRTEEILEGQISTIGTSKPTEETPTTEKSTETEESRRKQIREEKKGDEELFSLEEGEQTVVPQECVWIYHS